MSSDLPSIIEQLEIAVEAMLSDNAPPRLDERTKPLFAVAVDLQALPRKEFVGKLASELAARATSIAEPAVPARRLHTVTPYLRLSKAREFVAFTERAFDATERVRTASGRGGLHIEVQLGEDTLMVGGESSHSGTDRPTGLHYFVSDVDAMYERALQAGAQSLLGPVDQPYGVREAAVRDVAGNHWYISTPMKDTQGRPYVGLRTLAVYLHPQRADELMDFMQRGLGAEVLEVHRATDDGPVQHAKLRIADSIIEMGEAHGEWQPMPTTFFLHVDDPEMLFHRSLSAGATVLQPMGDQPYGRSGAVRDAHENEWYFVARQR